MNCCGVTTIDFINIKGPNIMSEKIQKTQYLITLSLLKMTASIEKPTKDLLNKLQIYPEKMTLWDGSGVTSCA